MAGIDYSIPGQFKGIQLESPMNQMAQAMQLRNLQETSQLNALRAQDAQRQSSQRNALSRIYADTSLKPGSPEQLARIQQEAPDLYEGVATRAAQQAELAEKIEGRKYQNFERKFKLYQSVTPTIKTVDDVSKFVSASYADPDLGPILTQIRPYADALNSNLDAFNDNPENWRLQAAGVSPEKIAEIARNKAKEEREVNKPVVVAPGGVLVSPSGEEIFKAPDREKLSDLARLQEERAAIAKENPADPRLAQYDAAIAKATTTNQPLSDLARKQNELADLEEKLKADPNNNLLKQRVKEYKDDIRKDTQWKPQTIVMQAPTLSVPAIDMAADRFLTDGTLPTGISKPNRDAIMNRAAAMAKDKGINPDRVAQLEVTANKQALGQLSKTETMVGSFERLFVKNADLALALGKKVDNTGVPLLQQYINAGYRASGSSPDLKALDTAIEAVASEYAKIVSGSMGNTAVAQGEKKRIRELINSQLTPQDLIAVINTMKIETKNRMEGFKEQRAELVGSMRSSTAAPKAPAGKVDTNNKWLK
jgi:hypothetical protein